MSSVYVFLEVEWVLRRYYNKPKGHILKHLRYMLAVVTLSPRQRHLLVDGMDAYQVQRGVNFVDCLIALEAKALKVDEFVTGDKKLARLYAKLLG